MALKKSRPVKKNRFSPGAKVRIILPGIDGVVTSVSDEPGSLGEYWHIIDTKFNGVREEPGCNLELMPPLQI
jgi:hypothetical protein